MNIVVYCGANSGNNKEYTLATEKLGAWIAKNNNSLVYGGGAVGLMRTVADSVLNNKGKVTGIMPEFLAAREIAHKDLTELIVVETMSERKQKMIELGDAFIALPGGPGTLEEITEVVSWARLGKNNSPCIFYNYKGFYNSIMTLYDTMVQEGFLTQEDRDKILFSESLVEIGAFINNYTPPEVRQY